MKYKGTYLNKFVLYATLASIVFFVLLCVFKGSGPWDVFVYLAVAAILLGLLILDFLWQLFQNN